MPCIRTTRPLERHRLASSAAQPKSFATCPTVTVQLPATPDLTLERSHTPSISTALPSSPYRPPTRLRHLQLAANPIYLNRTTRNFKGDLNAMSCSCCASRHRQVRAQALRLRPTAHGLCATCYTWDGYVAGLIPKRADTCCRVSCGLARTTATAPPKQSQL